MVEEKIRRVETTFWQDFTIAERFGKQAVVNTCNVSKQCWKHDIRYLAELVIVLNHKIWNWYEVAQEYPDNEVANKYAELYEKLWDSTTKFVLDRIDTGQFTKEEVRFYFETTD